MRHIAHALRFPLSCSYPGVIAGIAILGLAPLLGWALSNEDWFMFGGLGLLALMPVVARWPVITTFGIYAFLSVSLDAFPLLPGGATLTKPVGMLAGAVLLAAGLIERRLARPPQAALWWALFMLWNVCSLAWAIDTTLVTERLPTVLSLIVLYLVAASFRPTRRELYWVCALAILGGVLAAFLGYWFGSEGLTASAAGRSRIALGSMVASSGANANPNTLGRILLLPLALAIAGFVASRGVLRRAIALGCVGFIGFGIFLSISRGAIVAVAAMLAVLLYRFRIRWQAVAAVVLLLGIAIAMPDAFYDRFTAVSSGEDTTGSGRTEIWKAGLEVLERSPFVGIGLENFLGATPRGKPKDTPMHNIYLSVLVDLGIVGLALMTAALVSHVIALRMARRGRFSSILLAASEAAVVGTLTASLFSDDLWRKTFWLALTILTWAVYVERHPDDDKLARLPADPA